MYDESAYRYSVYPIPEVWPLVLRCGQVLADRTPVDIKQIYDLRIRRRPTLVAYIRGDPWHVRTKRVHLSDYRTRLDLRP